MAVAGYRSILVASVVCALVSAGLSLVTTWFPPELRAYVDGVNEASLTPTDVVAGLLGLVSGLAALIACVGLWHFRAWGRRVAVIATVVGLLITPLFGPTVQSGWTHLFYDTGSLLWGGLLALSYWSPLGARFAQGPAAYERNVPRSSARRPPQMRQAAAVLLVVYAGLSLYRAAEIWRVSPAPLLLAVGVLALPLALGLWKGTLWAWWGTLAVLLLMLAWMAFFAFVMLLTSEGRQVLLGLLTSPSIALASTTIEVLILILLLLPSGRAAFGSRAAA